MLDTYDCRIHTKTLYPRNQIWYFVATRLYTMYLGQELAQMSPELLFGVPVHIIAEQFSHVNEITMLDLALGVDLHSV